MTRGEHNVTLGVDLGQANDWSALVLTERAERWRGAEDRNTVGDNPGRRLESVHIVRHVERLALGTPYPKVVERVGEILRTPGLREGRLVVDATGVGRAVMDMFTDAYRDGECGWHRPKACVITSGTEVSGWHVPKMQLISRLVRLSQEGRLRFADGGDGLALASKLEQELQTFQLKMSKAGNVQFEARKESDHDDLVIALALSVFREHWNVTPWGLLPSGELVDRYYEAA